MPVIRRRWSPNRVTRPWRGKNLPEQTTAPESDFTFKVSTEILLFSLEMGFEATTLWISGSSGLALASREPKMWLYISSGALIVQTLRLFLWKINCTFQTRQKVVYFTYKKSRALLEWSEVACCHCGHLTLILSSPTSIFAEDYSSLDPFALAFVLKFKLFSYLVDQHPLVRVQIRRAPAIMWESNYEQILVWFPQRRQENLNECRSVRKSFVNQGKLIIENFHSR